MYSHGFTNVAWVPDSNFRLMVRVYDSFATGSQVVYKLRSTKARSVFTSSVYTTGRTIIGSKLHPCFLALWRCPPAGASPPGPQDVT